VSRRFLRGGRFGQQDPRKTHPRKREEKVVFTASLRTTSRCKLKPDGKEKVRYLKGGGGDNLGFKPRPLGDRRRFEAKGKQQSENNDLNRI